MKQRGVPQSKSDRKLQKLARAFANHKFNEVIAEANALLGRDRRQPELQVMLADALLATRQFAKAEEAYRQALGLGLEWPAALSNLGCALSELGQIEAAAEMFQRAIAADPSLSLSFSNYANHCARHGKADQAIELFLQAQQLNPANISALTGLGGIYVEVGEVESARRYLQQALALNPGNSVARRRMAVVQGVQKNGIAAFEQLCAIPSDTFGFEDKPLIIEVANSLCYQHEYDKAIQCFGWLAELDEDDPQTYFHLADVFSILGKPAETEICLRKVLEVNPDDQLIVCRLIHVLALQCAWGELGVLLSSYLQSLNACADPEGTPFALLSLSGISPAISRKVAESFAQNRISALQKVTLQPAVRNHKRLRVGYISADFRYHPVAYLVVGILEKHDRSNVEVYGYSYGGAERGSRSRIEDACDVFRDLKNDSLEQIAKQISDDEIDVLVDLTGWTEHTRVALLAYRPAPIQVTWLGYPGTLGSEGLADYLIGDPVVSPLETDAAFAEKLALMPHSYLPSDRERPVGEAPTRLSQGLPEQGVVFCSFNQAYKFNSETFDHWARILRAVPGSVLWLTQPSETACENLKREFEQRGLAPERLVFAQRMPSITEHLGRMQLADIALDTHPYNSHTTGSDALWVGVPLVTFLGDAFQSRVAASLLHSVGLPELIADSPDEYCELAIALAQDPDRLAALRQHLVDHRLTCPLFDTERFARDLEGLYARMWSDHQAGVLRHIA